jgi:hypothetical protein
MGLGQFSGVDSGLRRQWDHGIEQVEQLIEEQAELIAVDLAAGVGLEQRHGLANRSYDPVNLVLWLFSSVEEGLYVPVKKKSSKKTTK